VAGATEAVSAGKWPGQCEQEPVFSRLTLAKIEDGQEGATLQTSRERLQQEWVQQCLSKARGPAVQRKGKIERYLGCRTGRVWQSRYGEQVTTALLCAMSIQQRSQLAHRGEANDLSGFPAMVFPGAPGLAALSSSQALSRGLATKI
jgi:hypothetical protein